MDRKRFQVYLNVHLVLFKEDSVLLLQRKNTGYADGWYAFSAGHVEDGEKLVSAMIREAREEIGIELEPKNIELVHMMYRQSDRANLDVFFSCRKWQGTPKNCELHKCSEVQFFSKKALPDKCLPYVLKVLEYFDSKISFSDHGREVEHD